MSNRYFPIISERLQRAGVPDDFKYLCVAESSLVGNARSRSGAVGFWQFMDGTAPGYGLQVNSEVDERQAIEKSTDAACAYLKRAYEKFGNWTAAAASYNCGQGGYNSQATYQGTTIITTCSCPKKQTGTCSAFLRSSTCWKMPHRWAFTVKDEENIRLFRYVWYRLQAPFPTSPALHGNGTTYQMLRQLNPWLKGRSLTVRGGKTYELRCPPPDQPLTVKAASYGSSQPSRLLCCYLYT
jgi:membrane-bound lytic murein transglycosylase D